MMRKVFSLNVDIYLYGGASKPLSVLIEFSITLGESVLSINLPHVQVKTATS